VEKQVVFFAIGFETTAPANAAAVRMAKDLELTNFSLLVAQLLVPPAISAILSATDCNVEGFLAAGHVCTVMGFKQYQQIARDFQVPIVVTGFEPLDLLQGIHMIVKQLQSGCAEVENQYSRAVRVDGNQQAQELMNEVFTVADSNWRGFGMIPNSGLVLREEYEFFDARLRWNLETHDVSNGNECISKSILQGKRKPDQCPAFGIDCTPEHPLGPLMVSSEGACSAYYRYRKPSSSHERR
jgi:hydrogenase expression/formation protein HypD